MKWVPVLDAQGHVRMEMRWQVPSRTAETDRSAVVRPAA